MAKAKEEAKEVECTYTKHTACHFSYDGNDYSLHHGQTYMLPNCEFVKSLLEQGFLTAIK